MCPSTEAEEVLTPTSNVYTYLHGQKLFSLESRKHQVPDGYSFLVLNFTILIAHSFEIKVGEIIAFLDFWQRATDQ